jgi:hypothetical protein
MAMLFRSSQVKFTPCVLATVISVLCAANANAATLIGAVVHGTYLNPNTATVNFDAGTQTIANGTVFKFRARHSNHRYFR